MATAASANESLIVSRTSIDEAVRKAIRLYVGRGRRYSVKELSNGTGVPDRVIECAMCDVDSLDFRKMPMECLFSIGKFLGDGFTTEWMRLMGQATYTLPDDELPPEPELVAAFAEDTAEVAGLASDGCFCGDDQRELRSIGHRLIERGMSLVGVTVGRRRSGR